MYKRTILWYILFWGCNINYMFRMNINIAIVSMVKHSKNSTNVNVTHECPASIVSLKLNESSVQRISTDLDNNKFDWNEYEQNSVLGSFFTLHLLMQLPGGILAQRYGTKTVFGLSNGLGALLSFAIPVSAKISYKTLIGVRLLQGFISGAAWPAMHTLTANWIPPNERSRFVSAYLGSSVGTAITYIMCGYLITAYGWESVFYVSGALGICWSISWIFLVFDSPAKHPTISIKERTYIETCIGQTIKTRSKPLPIPWKSLLLSKALIINLVTQLGAIWSLFTLSTQAPTYFNFVLGLNIKQTGLWSGVPHFCRWVFAFSFGLVCDRLVKLKIMSMTNVRKMATCFCNILQGFFILGLCYAGCDSITAVIMLISATAVSGAVTSGALSAVVDIAPNYAGVIQGIIGTASVSTGFISPLIVGLLTLNQQTLNQWNKVFYLSGGICISTGLIYLFFGTSDMQKWNTYESPELSRKEMKLMLKKKENDNIPIT